MLFALTLARPASSTAGQARKRAISRREWRWKPPAADLTAQIAGSGLSYRLVSMQYAESRGWRILEEFVGNAGIYEAIHFCED